MSEFKFSESFSEDGQKSNNKKNFDFRIIFVIVVSLIAGISVYFVSNAMFGKKTNTTVPTVQSRELALDDEIVKNIYADITYGSRGVRAEKYLKEKSVKLENFTNYEKFYFALGYVSKDDFKDTGKVAEDGSNLKIYTISNDLIKKYMKQYFGEKITYSTDSNIPVTFNFSIDGFNTGVLKYDVSRAGYVITFNSNQDNISFNDIIKPYYTKLVSANIESDSSIVLKERIIYTKYYQYRDSSSNLIDKYDFSIYKDFNKTMLIEKKNGITKAMLDSNPINLDNYKNNANTITYTFKKDYNGNYYFYSSVISE